ncbi:hypothetical protein PROFUN_16005 [Planoprotostelium fungivorum]|uniref:Uncharacterized protein n=1 Tax=Planoprotostelium fungivorum TaxID=1890364 RepID=A0A2P6MR60_9EUKA|nr:hypothetical protein PROFUN_16005 [Planoprotostelium fungivorum]
MGSLLWTSNLDSNSKTQQPFSNIHTVPFGLYSKQFSEEDVMSRIMKNLAARVNIGLGQLKTYLQCTQDQLKTHLASQFYSGMSLMNYGVLWNLDHTIPASFARDNLKALCIIQTFSQC